MAKKKTDKKKTALERATELVLECQPRLAAISVIRSEHKLSHGKAVEVYAEALRQWGGDVADPIGNVREVVLDQTYAMLREALADRDHRAITKYMDMIAKTRGTYAPERTEVADLRTDGPESESRLEELLRKYEGAANEDEEDEEKDTMFDVEAEEEKGEN